VIEPIREQRIDFFGPLAKARVQTLVSELEKASSVEVIVSVHPRSASYRDAEWLAGALFAAAWLAVFLYHPVSFDFTFLPLELAGAFLAGALLARAANPVKRLLTRRRAASREVDRAAKTAFHDLGVSRTRARTGVLVFVSMLEGRAQLVPDVGVPKLDEIAALGPRLNQAVRQRDLLKLASVLAELGPAFARVLPKAHDDRNELSDELQEGA